MKVASLATSMLITLLQGCDSGTPTTAIQCEMLVSHVEDRGTATTFLISDKTRADYNVCKQQQKIIRADNNLARESCKQAVRKLSSAPTTLTWDHSIDGPSPTDGGYFVRISGNDVSGRFSATCYMDTNYSVTHVR
jgi:hypothetical protein